MTAAAEARGPSSNLQGKRKLGSAGPATNSKGSRPDKPGARPAPPVPSPRPGATPGQGTPRPGPGGGSSEAALQQDLQPTFLDQISPEDMCVRLTMVSAVETAWAFCVVVTTLLEPLVFSHVDGDTQLAARIRGEAGEGRGGDDRLLDQAETACRAVLPRGKITLIPAGLTLPERAPVLAVPVAFAPPPDSIVRTAAQRRSRLAAGATFLFMTVAAFAGTPIYRVAAPALARVNSFVRPAADLREAMLAGAVLADAVRFRFGGREVSSLVRDTQPHRSGAGFARYHCAEVHRQEEALIQSLRQ